MQDRRGETIEKAATWAARLLLSASTVLVPEPKWASKCLGVPVILVSQQNCCFFLGPHSRTGNAPRGSRTSSRRSMLRQQSTMEQPTLPRVQRQSRQDNRPTQDLDMGFMNVPEQGAAGSEPETIWDCHQQFHCCTSKLVLELTHLYCFCDCHHLFAGCSAVAPRR